MVGSNSKGRGHHLPLLRTGDGRAVGGKMAAL